MKKVLSFVLVLAMILGSVSMAFAETTIDYGAKTGAKPFEDAPNSKLATVLRDLKVLKGSDGKVFLDQPISRAEVCAILMRVLGYEAYCTADYAIDAVSSFKDVAKGYWANGYINLAAQLGYVNGVGNGNFNPLGNVGLNDGVAFIMKALGFSADHLQLEWPYNFLVKAESLGFLEGVEQTAGDLTREQMFTILYNAIDYPIQKWNPDPTNLFINQNDKIGEYKNAEPYATFQSKAKSGYFVNQYSSQKAVVSPTVVAAAAEVKLDLSAYEGKYVNFLTRETGAAIDRLIDRLAVLEVLTEELTGEPTLNAAKAIVSFAGVTITGPALTTPNIDDAYVIVNGKVGTWADQSANLKKSVDSKMEVALNAKGEISSIASISVWVDGEDHMITDKEAALLQSGIVASQKALAKSWGKEFRVSAGAAKDGSEDVILKLEVMGDATNLEDIKEDDVVTVYADSTNEIHRIVVCRDVVTGIISKSQVKSGVQYLTVGGKAYPAVTLFNADDFNYVSQHALYLNAEGSVYYLENVETPTVAKATWTKAIVASATAVKASYLEGTKLVDKTYATVSLVPFGTSTAVKYENVSPKALEVFFANETSVPCTISLDAGFVLGDIIEFAVKGEELASVRAISANTTYAAATALMNKNNLTGITVSAVGIASDNKLFADDVEIYVISQAAAGATAKVKMLAKASAAGLVFKDIKYHLNATGKIDALFCYNEVVVEAEVVPDHVTIAAIIGKATDKDGTYLVALVDGKEVELYVSYADDAVEPAIGSICALDLEDDEVISASKADTYKVAGGKADGNTGLVKGLKYVDGVLSTTNGGATYAEVGQFLKPVIYVKGASITTIDEATFAETAAKYTYAEYVDFNGDGYYDFLVVGAPETAPTPGYIYNPGV